MDGSIKIWNLSEKHEEFSLNGHSGIVNSVSFSPNGRLLASGSEDNTIKVWDLSTRSIKFELTGLLPNELTLKFSPKNLLTLIHKASSTVSSFDDKGISIPSQKSSTDSNSLVLSFLILENQKFQSLDLFNALFMISEDRWDSIMKWDVLFTNLSFTPLHLAVLSGLSKVVEKALEPQNSVRLLADAFGYSPLHYSILKKYQKVTDIIIEYILQKLKQNIPIFQKASMMHSIRNDLPIIIQNSPKSLCNLLSQFLYSIDPEPIHGEAKISILFSNSAMRSFSDFLKPENEMKNLEPLIIKTSWFLMPSNIGSIESIILFKELVDTKEKNIFKIEFIRSFIQLRWNQLENIIYLYSGILWINLVLITLLLLEKNSIIFFIISGFFIFINVVLLIWEIFQIVAVGIDYIKDPWNFIDLVKILIGLAWPFLTYLSLNPYWLNWFLVLFSVLRGLTSFRAFDSTRFYIKLIIESLKDVSSFLMIFVYATLSYGLLSVASEPDPTITGEALWINAFGIAFGGGGDIEPFTLQYGTYIIAIILNVVLMLNMIISIFGNSFDEFQLMSTYYNYKEMTEVILELEYIFSFMNKSSEFKYIHTIENPYVHDSDLWKEEAVENKEFFEKNDTQIQGVKDDVKAVNDTVKVEIKAVKDEVKADINSVKEEVKADIKSVKDDFKAVKDNIKLVENKITSMEEKLEAITKILLQPK